MMKEVSHDRGRIWILKEEESDVWRRKTPFLETAENKGAHKTWERIQDKSLFWDHERDFFSFRDNETMLQSIYTHIYPYTHLR